MVYRGSKRRIVADLLPFIYQRLTDITIPYVESFMGSGAVLSEVRGGLRYGFDSNPYLVALLNAARHNDVKHRDITREEFAQRKASIKLLGTSPLLYYDPTFRKDLEYLGYVGYIWSYNGVFYDAYVGNGVKVKGGIRNYADEKYCNLMRGIEGLMDSSVMLGCCTYESSLEGIMAPAVVYCDPPYADTKGYMGTFDKDVFCEWVRQRVSEGYYVFVSEYSMPEDFICVWQKCLRSSHKCGTSQSIERLFVHRSQL